MKMPDPKGWHCRGYLPHFDSPEIVQHIVLRTLNSLPASLMDRLAPDAAGRRGQVDAWFDRLHGEQPLADATCAAIVVNCLKASHPTRYRLCGWCVMPNHAHVLIEQMPQHNLGGIVKLWKMTSTHAINLARGTTGKFWAPDYFDRFMRNERDFEQTLAYIEANPVKAGLAATPGVWRFSSAFEAQGAAERGPSGPLRERT